MPRAFAEHCDLPDDPAIESYTPIADCTVISSPPPIIDAPDLTFDPPIDTSGGGTPGPAGPPGQDGQDGQQSSSDGGGGGGCIPCGWLRDRTALIEGDRVLKVQIFGNATAGGRCECITDQGDDPDAPHPWIAKYESGLGFWVLKAVAETCCGCARMGIDFALVPTVVEDPSGEVVPVVPAYGTLVVTHSCTDDEPYTYALVYECCTEDTVTFTAVGPKNCNEDMPEGGWPCNNSFKVVVTCSPCDVAGTVCEACDGGCGGPPYWEVQGIFTGAFSDYHGSWYLQPLGGCLWRAVCHDITVTLELTLAGENGVATLTYTGPPGTVVYSLTETGPFHCYEDSVLSAISGGSGGATPATVDLLAIYCEPCAGCCPGVVLPASLTATLGFTGSESCPSCLNGLEVVLTGGSGSYSGGTVCVTDDCQFTVSMTLACMTSGGDTCGSCGNPVTEPSWCVSGTIVGASLVGGACLPFSGCLQDAGFGFCKIVPGTEVTCDPFALSASGFTLPVTCLCTMSVSIVPT